MPILGLGPDLLFTFPTSHNSHLAICQNIQMGQNSSSFPSKIWFFANSSPDWHSCCSQDLNYTCASWKCFEDSASQNRLSATQNVSLLTSYLLAQRSPLWRWMGRLLPFSQAVLASYSTQPTKPVTVGELLTTNSWIPCTQRNCLSFKYSNTYILEEY